MQLAWFLHGFGLQALLALVVGLREKVVFLEEISDVVETALEVTGEVKVLAFSIIKLLVSKLKICV